MPDLAPQPNYVDQFAQAFQAGRDMAKSKGVQNALSMAPTDPSGAASALMQYGEFGGANALMQNMAQQRALKTQAAVAPQIQAGDLAGAQKTAAAAGSYDVAGEIGKLDEQQRTHAADTADVVSRAAYGLSQIPLDQGPDPLASRKAGLQKLAPMLTARGVSPDQIAQVDLSDQGLTSIAHQAMSIKDTVAANQKNTELGQQEEHNKATEALTAQEQAQTAAYHKAELSQGATRLGIEAQSANRAASQVLQDKDGTPYVYNTSTKSATTLQGQPYTPQGAQKLASGNPRSAAAVAVQRYLQENPDASSDDVANFNADYRKKATAASAFATGSQGKTVNSLNVAVQHLAVMQQAADALNNGNVQLFNQVAKNWQAQTGNPAPTNFDTVKQMVAGEVVKAVTGAGAGGVADREHAQSILNRANSPAQLSQAIGEIKTLMGGQLSGLKLQYKNATGLDDFETHLAPATQAALESHGATGSRPPLSSIFGH